MAVKDASATANAGHVMKAGVSPYESRYNVVDFSKFNLAANNADQLNVMPLAAGEFVQAAYIRIESPSTNTGVTIQLIDSRVPDAIVASVAGDAAAGTVDKGAGVGLGVTAATDGYLQLEDSHATVALNTGIVSVYAVIGLAWGDPTVNSAPVA